MNIEKVYTPPTCIERGIYPSTRDIGHAMNIGRVYTTPTCIARGTYPLTGGIEAHNEYWKGAHPSNSHREQYRRLERGYRGTQLTLGGCTPLQSS